MKGYCINPVKVEKIETISDADFSVDTKGLCCRIKVMGGSIDVGVNDDTYNVYTMNSGEVLDFSGKIKFRTGSSTPIVYLMFYRTV